MSEEYRALMLLARPTEQKAGDMWLCKRLGIVRVMTGHKRGTKRGQRPTFFHLYHWGERSMYYHACDWRENDNNASTFDPDSPREEVWQYIGNMFDMIPYRALAGTGWNQSGCVRNKL